MDLGALASLPSPLPPFPLTPHLIEGGGGFLRFYPPPPFDFWRFCWMCQLEAMNEKAYQKKKKKKNQQQQQQQHWEK